MSSLETDFLKKRTSEIIKEMESKEFNKKVTLYFEFANTNERDSAMSYIRNLREKNKDFDENFRYFLNCSIDPNRSDIGIEIKFNKNPKNIKMAFEDILNKGGFSPKEEYETLDGEPVPEETKINN